MSAATQVRKEGEVQHKDAERERVSSKAQQQHQQKTPSDGNELNSTCFGKTPYIPILPPSCTNAFAYVTPYHTYIIHQRHARPNEDTTRMRPHCRLYALLFLFKRHGARASCCWWKVSPNLCGRPRPHSPQCSPAFSCKFSTYTPTKHIVFNYETHHREVQSAGVALRMHNTQEAHRTAPPSPPLDDDSAAHS